MQNTLKSEPVKQLDRVGTPQEIMEKTIGRSAKEFLNRKIPVFKEELIKIHNPFIKFCHSLFKIDKGI